MYKTHFGHVHVMWLQNDSVLHLHVQKQHCLNKDCNRAMHSKLAIVNMAHQEAYGIPLMLQSKG